MHSEQHCNTASCAYLLRWKGDKGLDLRASLPLPRPEMLCVLAAHTPFALWPGSSILCMLTMFMDTGADGI